MEEIRDAFSEQGGWSEGIFGGIADIFRLVAEREEEELEQHTDVDGFVDEVCERLQRIKPKL